MPTAPSTFHEQMSPDEEAALLDAIQKWIDKEVRPVVQKYDHADEWPADIVEQMKEMGLFGATIGQEYGGLGLSAVTYAKIVAMISSYWMAITGIVLAFVAIGLSIVMIIANLILRARRPELNFDYDEPGWRMDPMHGDR